MGKLKDTTIEGNYISGDLLSKIAKLYILNNFNPVSNGIRSYYAEWANEYATITQVYSGDVCFAFGI